MTEAVSAQVPDEARRKLADELQLRISRVKRSIGETHAVYVASVGSLICFHEAEIIAALRAQPERGAEEIAALVRKAMFADREIQELRFSERVSAMKAISEEIAAAIRALPLNPAKDDGAEG